MEPGHTRIPAGMEQNVNEQMSEEYKKDPARN